MSARTIIGRNIRTVTPGGFSRVRHTSKLYQDAREANKAATVFLESRGIHHIRDGFNAKQKAHMAEVQFTSAKRKPSHG
jgi:hypothetical protein